MSEHQTHRPTLKRESVGLAGAVVQSAALVGPAGGASVGMVFVAGQAGIASPFVLVVGTIFSICLALVIGEFARKIPAAGSFYNYLASAFGAKSGFVTGVLLFGAYLVLLPFQLAFFGTFVQEYLSSHDISLSWQWPAAALIILATVLGAAGVAPTLRVGLVTLAFEIVVFVAIAVAVLVQGGASGLSLKPFDPSVSAQGFSGVVYGLVFAIFVFVGFESATTLSEEARDPSCTIPRAVVLTAVAIGVFYVLMVYSGVIGFGTNADGLKGLQTDGAPFNTLADRYIGSWAASLTTLAVMSSFVALNIVTVSAAARMIFAMARDGMLPRALAKTNARTAPAVAVVLVGLFALVTTLCIGGIWSPGELAGWSAYVGTLFFIAAYALLVVGLPRFFLRAHRDEFSTLRHVVVPVVGLVGVCVVAYGNIHPTPPAPLRYFVWATIAFIAVAAATAVWLERSDPEKLAKAGKVFGSEDDAVTGRPVVEGAAHG